MSKVPSQTRAAFCGSRISAAHFPHGRCLTPRYLRFFAGGGNGATVSAGSEDGPPPSGVGVGVALALPSPSNVLVRVCTASAQQKHHQCNQPQNIPLNPADVCTSEPSKRLAKKLTCEKSKGTKTPTRGAIADPAKSVAVGWIAVCPESSQVLTRKFVV